MKRNVPLLFITLLTIFQVAAQTKTWTGTSSAVWAEANNWNPVGIPTATDDVTIPSAPANQPILSINAGVAKSVEVQSGATLTIAASGQLTINDSKSFMVELSTQTTAFLNRGTVANSGGIVLGNNSAIGQLGLWNTNMFNNNSGGVISIDRSTSIGLWNSSGGTFTNVSEIRIGSNASVGAIGLRNDAIFNNNTGGVISIDRSTSTGLLNILGGTFTNFSEIRIGSNAGVGIYGLSNAAIFNNNAGGVISIDGSTTYGLYNSSGTFTNFSEIRIGSNAGVGIYGLSNAAIFNNNAGGVISIDRSTTIGLDNNRSGTFTNVAEIRIGSTASVGGAGLYNAAIFNNNAEGMISIDRSSDRGLWNNSTGTFTNVSEIRIGSNASVGNIGLQNDATFNNNENSELNIDNATGIGLYNNGSVGKFTNAAKVTIGTIAPVGSNGIQNSGVFSNTSVGEIKIDNSSSSGLYNEAGTFTNAAKITIGGGSAVGLYGVYNASTFNNSPCAEVSVLDGPLKM